MKLKLFILLALASSFSFADMMYIPTKNINIQEIESHYRALGEGKNSDLIFILALARDLQLFKTIELEGEKTDSLEKTLRGFTKERLTLEFGNQLFKKMNWTKALSKTKLEKIKANKSQILKLISLETYAGTWFHYQSGEKTQAIKSLKILFEREHKKMKALDNVTYGFGESPMMSITRIYKTLMWITDGSEKDILKDRFRKLKVHVSNLPQTHINT